MNRRAPTMAALPSSATATVWTAARRAPKRELMTPVARNNWKVSAGMRNRSNRNGTAAVRLPKNVSRPASASRGYSVTGTAASANHPANRMKLIDKSLPVWGKLNDVGTITSGNVLVVSSTNRCRSSSSLHAWMRIGRTMNKSAVMKAVMSASRVGPSTSLITKRGKRRDQSRQYPQRDKQTDGHIRDQVHLDPGDLLDVQRPGRVSGNGEDAVGRQTHDKFRGAR